MNDLIRCPHCHQEFETKKILTERELEIALLITKDLSAKEVAKKLYISEKTVKNHLVKIYRKLELKNRIALVKYLLKCDIINISDM